MNKELFNEAGTGRPSSTRWMFIVGILYAMGFTAAYTFISRPFPDVGSIIALFTGMSGIFVGLKLGQKPMEEKSKK